MKHFRLMWVSLVLFGLVSVLPHCGPGTGTESVNEGGGAESVAEVTAESPASEPGAEPGNEPGKEPGAEPVATDTNDAGTGPETQEPTPESTTTETVPEGSAGAEVFGDVVDFVAQTPLAGVKVCVTGPQGVPCVNTDSQGKYRVTGIPKDVEFVLSYEKTGYVKVLQPMAPNLGSEQNIRMISEQTLPLFANLLGVQIKKGMGAIVVSTFNWKRTQFVAGLSLSSDATGAEGPFYINAQGMPSKTLTKTSAAGLAFFVNVPPGNYIVKTKGTGGMYCAAKAAVPGPNEDEFKVLVEADAFTYVGTKCERRVAMSGTVTDFVSGNPIDQVKVCLQEPKGVPCVTTDAKGTYRLPGVPSRDGIYFSMEKQGYLTNIQTMDKGQSASYSVGMLQKALIPQLAALAGVQVKPNTGVITMRAFRPVRGFESGMTLSMKVSGATGPIYFGTNGFPDPKLKATSAAGLAAYINIPPGVQVAEFAGTSKHNCRLGRGWLGQNKGEARAKVEADSINNFFVTCERPLTRKVDEACYNSDIAKPEYDDCVADHVCTSGKCVAAPKRFASCTTERFCASGDVCVGSNIATISERYCLQPCDPSNPQCAQDYQCLVLSSGRGACLKKCSAKADCNDYGTACESVGSSTQQFCQ
ncbi:MAG: carboxypeptidase regulatory-like domain-containing protein [Deltaproteobacteria bacterium]|nr:MAG: carboxypeptidase regulatory-like domain-containing protein [Deltaproteobacteria bacterium]